MRRTWLTLCSKPIVDIDAAVALGQAVLQPLTDSVAAAQSLQRVRDAHSLVSNCLAAVHPTMKLYTFGSVVAYGVLEPKSDVDFVVLREDDIRDGKAEDSATELAKALQTDALAKLAAELRRRHPSLRVEEVKRTRVPVLRMQDRLLGDFDVSAFRRNGVRNSALLRAYFSQKPDIRWVSMAIKSWSKRSGMNQSVKGYLTSYGFNIMVVYYFLQRQLLSFVDPATCDVSSSDAIPNDLPLPPPDDRVTAFVGESVAGFLDFYVREFDFDRHVITLSRPDVTTKEGLRWTTHAEEMKALNAEKVFYRVAIEDPYEINLNVGRNIRPLTKDLMMKTFKLGQATGLGLLKK